MSRLPLLADPESWVAPPEIWRWLRWVLWSLAWVGCLGMAAERLHSSWNECNTVGRFPEQYHRRDNNAGHTYIDFGGQWLSGRMIYEGYGRDLYNRNRLHEVARRNYPVEDEHPTSQEAIIPPNERRRGAKDKDAKHDADALVGWLMGRDPPEWQNLGQAVALPLQHGSSGNPFAQVALQSIADSQVNAEMLALLQKPVLGGPLYPPIHGFFYAPLAAFKPQTGYHMLQTLCVLAALASGLAMQWLSRGKVWWPLASWLLLMLPGTRPGLDLGQNNLISTWILILGWALFVRDRPIAAGIVWGLLAYKPVWAVAFLLVPMLMGQVRFFLAMVATGGGLIGLTLPFVGLETWMNWVRVGRLASGIYSTDQNWVRLSRDLAGVIRRLVVNTDISPVPASSLADTLAWVVPGLLILTCAAIYLMRADRTRSTGIAPAFVLLTAYLGCFRFMYYDVTLAYVALAALFAQPRFLLQTPRFTLVLPSEMSKSRLGRRSAVGYVNSFPLLILALLWFLEVWVIYSKLHFTVSFDGYSRAIVNTQGSTGVHVPRLSGNSDYHYPLDTYLLLALWFWCAWRVWRDGRRAA